MRTSYFFTLVLACTLTACSTPPREDYPKDANSGREISRLEMGLQKAKARQYDLLAPYEFAKSEEYLNEARAARARDTNLDKTWRNLSYSRGYFKLGEQRVRERKDKVEDVLTARAGALNAGAHRHMRSEKSLEALDARFRQRAKNLDGNRDESFWVAMKNNYANVEVEAVQEARLGNARRLVTEARSNGASTYAPRALKQTYEVLAAADRAIAANPRREDGYKDQVEAANDAARWLTAVNATARSTTQQTAEQIARGVVERNNRMADMKAELTGTALEAEVNRRALATSAADLRRLKNEVSNERELEQAVANVREKFTADEADIYRDGDRLLIQLKQIGFQPGSAQVPEGSKPLLTKVKAVIEGLHPQELVVQGHADATGSANTNKKISAERASVVADYLGDVVEGVETEGLSDGRPIRSNKTSNGRAVNRRVDLIVTPTFK
ncbi:MAG: OmpA family protein [Bdellovibrionales bacterium]|nr:OmpA family protein [Bdellovibrionales bacterium]